MALLAPTVKHADSVTVWAAEDGLAAAVPFGNTLVNARTDRDVEIDLALFGVETGSFLDPAVAFGSAAVEEGDVVISSTAAEEGVEVGDTIILQPSGAELRVVDVLEDQHTWRPCRRRLPAAPVLAGGKGRGPPGRSRARPGLWRVHGRRP